MVACSMAAISRVQRSPHGRSSSGSRYPLGRSDHDRRVAPKPLGRARTRGTHQASAPGMERVRVYLVDTAPNSVSLGPHDSQGSRLIPWAPAVHATEAARASGTSVNGLYYFQAYGYGMQATYQYDIPMDGDDSHYENGLLVIGTLTLHEKAHAYYNRPIYFISDLGGRVQQGCVLAMPSGEWKRFPAIHDIEDVMRDLVTYRDCWTKVADSFTDWLEEVASTQGTLGYIPVREP